MTIDYKQLLDDLDDEPSGPTLAEARAERAHNELILRALERLAEPQTAPQVTLQPEIKVETLPAQVVVQPAEARRPVAWTIEFERNTDGTIKRMHVSPKE